MPSSVSSILHLLYSICTATNEISSMIIIPLLHRRRLRHREVKELAEFTQLLSGEARFNSACLAAELSLQAAAS